MPRLVDQFPSLKPLVVKFAARMAADPQFSSRFLAGEVDLDGQLVPRSPEAVARVKQAKLRTGRIGYLGHCAIGPTASFVGGHPDASASFDWPSWQGRDLTFIAQVDLADLRNDDQPEWLPASGKLLFFAGQDDLGEYTPAVSRVLHIPASRYAGMSAQEACKPQYLSFERHTTYAPLGPEDEVRQADDTNEVLDWFDRLVPSHDSALWQVGGWPRRRQPNDMRQECERRYRGLASDDFEAQNQPCFQQAMDTWHLIGQFDLEAIVTQPSGFTTGVFWAKVESGQALFDQAMLVARWD